MGKQDKDLNDSQQDSQNGRKNNIGNDPKQPQLQQSRPNETDGQKKDHQNIQKKKIIKKFPFTSGLNKPSVHKVGDPIEQEDSDIKNWKPISINAKNNLNNKSIPITGQSKKKQIANTFLSFLPKPALNTKEQQDSFKLSNPLLNKKKPLSFSKPLIQIKPSQQQLKWDQEDEFIHKKQLISKNVQKEQKMNNEQKIIKDNQEKLVEVNDEEDLVVEKIKWLENQEQGVNKGNSKNGKKRNVSLAQIIEKGWEKELKGLNQQDDN